MLDGVRAMRAIEKQNHVPEGLTRVLDKELNVFCPGETPQILKPLRVHKMMEYHHGFHIVPAQQWKPQPQAASLQTVVWTITLCFITEVLLDVRILIQSEQYLEAG